MKGRRPDTQDHGILSFLVEASRESVENSRCDLPGSDGRHFDPDWQAQPYDAEKITDVKVKLHDHEYIEGAVSRIATLVSSRLVKGRTDGGRKTRG